MTSEYFVSCFNDNISIGDSSVPRGSPKKALKRRKSGGGEEKIECMLKKLTASDSEKTGGRFWPDGWRNKLCKCDECMVSCGCYHVATDYHCVLR